MAWAALYARSKRLANDNSGLPASLNRSRAERISPSHSLRSGGSAFKPPLRCRFSRFGLLSIRGFQGVAPHQIDLVLLHDPLHKTVPGIPFADPVFEGVKRRVDGAAQLLFQRHELLHDFTVVEAFTYQHQIYVTG